MTIKIDKPKGCMVVWDLSEKPIPVRIVRESDWRRVMAVVRAARGVCDDWLAVPIQSAEFSRRVEDRLADADKTLRKHLEKRK